MFKIKIKVNAVLKLNLWLLLLNHFIESAVFVLSIESIAVSIILNINLGFTCSFFFFENSVLNLRCF